MQIALVRIFTEINIMQFKKNITIFMWFIFLYFHEDSKLIL